MTLPSDVSNALIVAQNALSGYVALANGFEAETDLKLAQHAFEAVKEAIRVHGVLEQQETAIHLGDTVRLTDAYRRTIQASSPFRNGQVVDLHDTSAEGEWLDPALPRVIEASALEKVERKKSPAAWTEKAADLDVGDEVRYSPKFLRSTGQVAGKSASMTGEILEVRHQDKPYATAVVAWHDREEPGKVLLSNLARAEARGRS